MKTFLVRTNRVFKIPKVLLALVLRATKSISKIGLLVIFGADKGLKKTFKYEHS